MTKKPRVTTVDGLPLVSAEVCCDLLGVSKQTFAVWISDGLFERQGTRGYEIRSVVRAVYKEKARSSRVIEHARRQDWRQRTENAKLFAAMTGGDSGEGEPSANYPSDAPDGGGLS
jgi:hypothetical protein